MEPMLQLIQEFPEQLLRAAEICRNWRLSPTHSPENVLVCGMGGSGIAGKIISSAYSDSLSVPLSVVQDYRLPHYCAENSLVIVSSYSGNTEESIACFLDAVQRGCKPVCISSGGQLITLCEQYDCPYLRIPGGFPPRSQFGYGLIGVLHILSSFGLIDVDVPKACDAITEKLAPLQNEIIESAASIAETLKNKTICLYAEPRYLAVALRWRQQLNENSKMLCLCEAIPEMNHNELVGWGAADSTYGALFMHSASMHERIQRRFEISEGLIKSRTSAVFNVHCPEEDTLFTIAYFVHFGDWLSWHLANQRGFDPVAIPEIEFLKAEMSR